MDFAEELKSAGAYPTGPVSAWPKSRHDALTTSLKDGHATKVKAGMKDMITGFSKATGQAVRFGKVSAEIRKERYDTCKSCPAFIEASKRCSECGCFMEAKSWIGGNPDTLCPLKKWSR